MVRRFDERRVSLDQLVDVAELRRRGLNRRKLTLPQLIDEQILGDAEKVGPIGTHSVKRQPRPFGKSTNEYLLNQVAFELEVAHAGNIEMTVGFANEATAH